jgi:hypothetical protein
VNADQFPSLIIVVGIGFVFSFAGFRLEQSVISRRQPRQDGASSDGDCREERDQID